MHQRTEAPTNTPPPPRVYAEQNCQAAAAVGFSWPPPLSASGFGSLVRPLAWRRHPSYLFLHRVPTGTCTFAKKASKKQKSLSLFVLPSVGGNLDEQCYVVCNPLLTSYFFASCCRTVATMCPGLCLGCVCLYAVMPLPPPCKRYSQSLITHSCALGATKLACVKTQLRSGG